MIFCSPSLVEVEQCLNETAIHRPTKRSGLCLGIIPMQRAPAYDKRHVVKPENGGDEFEISSS